jgi:Domain of unknown function (DUF4105)
MKSFLLGILFLALHSWALAALWIDGPGPLVRRIALVSVYAGVLLGSALITRRFRPPLLASLIPFAVVITWWILLSPSNDRDWMPDVVRLTSAEIDGDRLVIHNVRNFDYRSEDDYTERWETRTYDLAKLRGVDFFLSTWGSPYIAHTIVSWDFGDGDHLAISIETRKERTESYSAILGFFRQYELYYVVADERDVIRVRTNYRGEQVRLYPLTTSREVARAVLLQYMDEINSLNSEPVWYNALTQNCTTTIRRNVRHVARGNRLDWRILVNGRIDELGYERGNVDTSLPFEELRRRSIIGDRARASDPEADFSAVIREGLPGH